MKMKKTIILLAILLTCGIAVALDLRFSAPLLFSKTQSVAITAAHPHPFKLSSITMGFALPVTNKFQVFLKRGTNQEINIYTVDTNVYQSVSWLLEGGINITTNDTLIFTNSSAATATLIYNYEI